MSDRLAALAYRTYASAKCSPSQVLPWDGPPQGHGLPELHRRAWRVVTMGVLILEFGADEEEDEAGVSRDAEEVPRAAWSAYVSVTGAKAFAMPWERASDEHKAAWRAVVAALREEAKAWG